MTSRHRIIAYLRLRAKWNTALRSSASGAGEVSIPPIEEASPAFIEKGKE